MADNIRSAYCWTITRIAETFSMDRGTVRRKLRAAGVSPATSDGRYRLADAVPALYRQEPVGQDPDEMTPQDRRAWYDSESARIAVESRVSHLVKGSDAEGEISQLANVLSHRLDTLLAQLAEVLTDDALGHVRRRVALMKDMLAAHEAAE